MKNYKKIVIYMHNFFFKKYINSIIIKVILLPNIINNKNRDNKRNLFQIIIIVKKLCQLTFKI